MTRIVAVRPVLSVKDVVAAVRFYERLAFRRVFVDDESAPRYAGVARDDVELHLQWHDATEWSYPVDRPAIRFVVDDVDAFSAHIEALQPTGKRLDRTPVSDTAWGTREFHVRDIDGNVLQFFKAR
jgi:hypothetical protein